ncbi:MAG: methylenetetrahydrofolate reductase [NAD(P)H] [Clostridiaceae bacterium]|jgi:methylenetetrahydrofolate reductase (NADPH)|nr:methylenetetrahydrofolate reductase [Oscillospiraceae bacterium]NLO63391.1 methylenetetrahydrofolate reductase [NAD(P)H] [Clostridiaceae bacterium]
MRIVDIIRSKPVTFSLEVFPPKTDDRYDTVAQAVSALSFMAPDYMSVTYGAGGGTSKNTVRIATEIEKIHHTTALAHLTCLSSTREEVRGILGDLRDNGIRNILALRGDQPHPDSGFPVPHDYRYAYELVNDIRAFGDFCVGAACHPEGHPDRVDPKADIEHLRNKVECGVDFLVTQFFFDNGKFYDYADRVRAAGVNTPIIIGVMPVTSVKSLRRMIAISGTSLTPRMKTLLDRWGDDPDSMAKAGVLHASEQILDLVSNGFGGIHIYTMNKPQIASAIRGNIGFLLGD